MFLLPKIKAKKLISQANKKLTMFFRMDNLMHILLKTKKKVKISLGQ